MTADRYSLLVVPLISRAGERAASAFSQSTTEQKVCDLAGLEFVSGECISLSPLRATSRQA